MPEATPMVFVVEDDSSVREALAGLIRSAGWNVEVFVSAHDFLGHQRADAPSCLVLDVGLPGLSGLELQTRMAETHNDIPIVFITGHGDIPMSVRAMKAGAVEFLTKPFVDQDLLDGIQTAIERHRAVRSEDEELQELRESYASLTPRERQVMELVISGRLPDIVHFATVPTLQGRLHGVPDPRRPRGRRALGRIASGRVRIEGDRVLGRRLLRLLAV